jgi:coenzyme PQQ precursor peptide PqqA
MKPWKKPRFEEVVLALEVKGYVNVDQPVMAPADGEERSVARETSPAPARERIADVPMSR